MYNAHPVYNLDRWRSVGIWTISLCNKPPIVSSAYSRSCKAATVDRHTEYMSEGREWICTPCTGRKSQYIPFMQLLSGWVTQERRSALRPIYLFITNTVHKS